MSKQKEYFSLFIIILLFVFVTKFFNFHLWRSIPYVVNIRYCLLFILPIWAISVYRQSELKNAPCEKYIRYFIFVSIFTTIIRISYFGGGLIANDLELNIFMLSIYSTYYLLHHYKIREHGIIVAFTIIGLVGFFIYVYQDFFPENALWGTRNLDEIDETGEIALKRNGLYRFTILNPSLYVFLLSYYWCKIIFHFKYQDFYFVICFSVQVYLMLTRQYYIATIGLIGYTVFFDLGNKNKKTIFVFLTIGIFLFIYYYAELFETLFDTENDMYVISSQSRIDAVPFFLSKAFLNPFLLLTGYGYPQQLWSWGGMGYWWNDIGVLGQIIPFGIIWVVVSFKLSYMIIVKWKDALPLYIRAYTFGLLTIFYMAAPYGNVQLMTFIWVCILYICDLYLCPDRKCLTNIEI